MLRIKATTIGMMVAVAALIFIATGCTTSNPLSPTDTSNDPKLSPGSEAILTGAEIDRDLVDDDLMTGEALNKIRPDFMEMPEDGPILPDPGDRLTDFELIE